MSKLTDSEDNNIIFVDFANVERQESPRPEDEDEGPMAFFDDEEWGGN